MSSTTAREDRHDFTDPKRLEQDLRAELAAATAALQRAHNELAIGGHPAPGWIPMQFDEPGRPVIGVPPAGLLVDIWKPSKYSDAGGYRIAGVRLEWMPCECDCACEDGEQIVHDVFVNEDGDDVLEGDPATHWRPAPLPPRPLLNA
jgi:hypothetical protein